MIITSEKIKEIKETWEREEGWYKSPSDFNFKIKIGANVKIGNYVEIDNYVEIGNNNYILTIQSKYTCHIVPTNPPKIRIGCRIHTIEEWEEIQKDGTIDRDGEREWWESHGKKIYETLKFNIEYK